MARQSNRHHGPESAPAEKKTTRYLQSPVKLKTRTTTRHLTPSPRPILQKKYEKSVLYASPVPQAMQRERPLKISAASVFKAPPKSRRREERSPRRKREQTPELISELKESYNTALTSISTTLSQAFTTTHSSLHARLTTISSSSTHFIDTLTHAAALLSAPLADEQIETRVRSSNGTQSTKIVRIGDCVKGFREVVEREGVKLKELWSEWDAVKTEYAVLQGEIFGRLDWEAPILGADRRGYKMQMEGEDEELEKAVKELRGEIEGVGGRVMGKLTIMEKQLDAATKKEQAQLLRSIMDLN